MFFLDFLDFFRGYPVKHSNTYHCLRLISKNMLFLVSIFACTHIVGTIMHQRRLVSRLHLLLCQILVVRIEYLLLRIRSHQQRPKLSRFTILELCLNSRVHNILIQLRCFWGGKPLFEMNESFAPTLHQVLNEINTRHLANIVIGKHHLDILLARAW